MEYTTYVIYNQYSAKIYIGQTADLSKRLARHNGLLPTKGTSYTHKNSGFWGVVYTEKFKTREEAVKREKELKSYQGRVFIKNLISNVGR